MSMEGIPYHIYPKYMVPQLILRMIVYPQSEKYPWMIFHQIISYFRKLPKSLFYDRRFSPYCTSIRNISLLQKPNNDSNEIWRDRHRLTNIELCYIIWNRMNLLKKEIRSLFVSLWALSDGWHETRKSRRDRHLRIYYGRLLSIDYLCFVRLFDRRSIHARNDGSSMNGLYIILLDR